VQTALKFVEMMQTFSERWLQREKDTSLQKALAESLQVFRKTPQYKHFHERVKTAYGFTLVDVARDGNCFFHAILDQMWERAESVLSRIAGRIGIGEESFNYHVLRKLTVGGLLKLAEDDDATIKAHAVNVEKYIQQASKEGAWADGMMIGVLSRVLNIKIVLLNSDANEPTIISGGNQATLYLGYEVQRHFQSARGPPSMKLKRYLSQKAQDPLTADALIDAKIAYEKGAFVEKCLLGSGAKPSL
jgi:hypothetical protein